MILLPSFISDTTYFIKIIETHTFETDTLLCTIDVSNMYTNIPLDEGNQAALRALKQLKTSKHLIDMPDIPVLADLLDMVTRNNVFEFNGEVYIQTKGVPMGNIMAPSYSGIFMGDLEKRLIQLDNDRIKIWVRYIDDIFVIWKGDQASFETFLSRCNDVHPTMKFTGECSPNEIHFLDTTVYKGTRFQNEQILDMKTHMKPTNKQTFVHSTSFHPKGVGKSIVLGETYRYCRTNTNQDTFDKQTRDLEQSLLKRGYKKTMIRPLIRSIHFKDRHKIIYKPKNKPNPPTTPTLALTYNTHIPKVRETLEQIWTHTKQDPILNTLFPETPRKTRR